MAPPLAYAGGVNIIRVCVCVLTHIANLQLPNNIKPQNASVCFAGMCEQSEIKESAQTS